MAQQSLKAYVYGVAFAVAGSVGTRCLVLLLTNHDDKPLFLAAT
ncbi:hypothetical protein [Caballeronia sp. J97]|nr:hypothetical protein [Caballeronia sp. J97]